MIPKQNRWCWLHWGEMPLFFSSIGVAALTAPLLAIGQPTTPVLAQATESLLSQVQGCIQKAITAQRQVQPQTQPNAQDISTRCLFSVVMLDAAGAVRPDASDRLSTLVRAMGLKPNLPTVQGQANIALRQKPGQQLFSIPVTLGKSRFSFILDTGASNTIIDPRLARQMNLKGKPVPSELLGHLVVGSATPAKEVQVYDLPPLTVGAAQVSRLSGIGLSTTTLPFKTHGILGLDFLSRFDIVINPQTRMLSLLKTSAPVASDVQLQGKLGVMILPDVRINGQGPFRFLVDTGAAMTTLAAPLAQKLALVAESTTDLQVAGLGGNTQAKRTHLQSLEMQTQRISELDVLVLDSKVFQTLGVEGVIGQDILNRYIQRWRFGPPGPLGSPEVGSLELLPLPPAPSTTPNATGAR
jgi:predicted aspartyl protease